MVDTAQLEKPLRASQPPHTNRIGALLGVVSAGAGLAASELASGFLHQRVSPLIAVAESILRLTPGAVAEKIIHLVQHYDKPLLIACTLIGLTALSALVGVVAMRSVMLAELGFVAMGVVLVMAVHSRLTPSESTYLPAVIGVVVAMVVLAWLSKYALRAVNDKPDSRAAAVGRETSRRVFLQTAGMTAALAVVVGATGRVLAHGRAAVDAARKQLTTGATVPRIPKGVEVGVDGVYPWNTAQNSFYRIDTALVVPQILPQNWNLRVHGMVDNEISLSFEDLLKYPLTEGWMTLCCVSNSVGGQLISNAWFSGVKISDVLADAGVQSGADAVLSRSDDGWTAGTPIQAVTDDRNALFAFAMNGEPLALEHGFPVRMVVPGLYGYVSATKWVVDLEVTQFSKFQAFWTTRGWSSEGPVKTESRIDVPRHDQTVKAGRVALGGVAWAQHTGIAKVEVGIDGVWAEARLGNDPTIDSWRQWAYVWDAEKGDHEIAVRATDDSGYTQTSHVADPVPDGASGWHTITVTVE